MLKNIFLCCIILLFFEVFCFSTDWVTVITRIRDFDPAGYDRSAKPIMDRLKDQGFLTSDEGKKLLDKSFKDSFESVFGASLKPSEALDLIRISEAVAAGDTQVSLKEGGNFLVSKFLPLVGNYIKLLESCAKLIHAVENDWVDGLYSTKAYLNLSEMILKERIRSGADPYVPSYLIKYDPKGQLAPDLKALQEKMRAFESKWFYEWSEGNLENSEAVRILSGPDWSARLRSALKRSPTNRELFNHFLYRITGQTRKVFLEKYQEHYLLALSKKLVKLDRNKFMSAMAKGLRNIVEVSAAKTSSGISEITIRANLVDEVEGIPAGARIFYSFRGSPTERYKIKIGYGRDGKLINEKTLYATADGSSLVKGDFIARDIDRTGDYRIGIFITSQDGRTTKDAITLRITGDPEAVYDPLAVVIKKFIRALDHEYKKHMDIQAQIKKNKEDPKFDAMMQLRKMVDEDYKRMDELEKLGKLTPEYRKSADFHAHESRVKQHNALYEELKNFQEWPEIQKAGKDAWIALDLRKRLADAWRKKNVPLAVKIAEEHPLTKQLGFLEQIRAEYARTTRKTEK